jgi:hypothetical protein
MLQRLRRFVGLLKEEAVRNSTRAIKRIARRVDDSDVWRASRARSLGHVLAGQLSRELNVGKDNIDAVPRLQVGDGDFGCAGFEDVAPGAS